MLVVVLLICLSVSQFGMFEYTPHQSESNISTIPLSGSYILNVPRRGDISDGGGIVGGCRASNAVISLIAGLYGQACHPTWTV